MKKNFILLGLCSSLVFTGCSSYSITKYFNKNDLYLKSVQYTEKVDVIEKNEVKALLTATYLNVVDKKYDDENQNFIVGIYIVNNKNDNNLLNSIFTLNEKDSIEIKELDKNHEMNGNIPLKNNWAKYYLIKFNKNEKINDLKLEYKYANFQQVNVSFEATRY